MLHEYDQKQSSCFLGLSLQYIELPERCQYQLLPVPTGDHGELRIVDHQIRHVVAQEVGFVKVYDRCEVRRTLVLEGYHTKVVGEWGSQERVELKLKVEVAQAELVAVVVPEVTAGVVERQSEGEVQVLEPVPK